MKATPLAEGADTEFNLDDYEVIPPQAVASTKILVDMWERLGRPETPFTDSGAKLMNIIIAIWEDGYPKQRKQWLQDRAEYKKNEMDITEQVSKHTGRSLASYPMPVYGMMQKLFPGFDPAKRDNCLKMVRKWPIFKMANKA